MTVTTTNLTRAAGVAAVAAGVLFVGVQVGHPELDTISITTTEVYIRDSLKILMAVLALIGITGMYLSQVRRNGVLGLVGYVLLVAGYLLIMCGVYVAAYVLPEIAEANAGYVSDVLTIDAGRGGAEGDIGPMQTVIQLRGFAYLAGGLLFGIALYRAHVLARWAAALLAVGGVVSVVLSLMPDAFYRLLAVPNAIAMVGLGFSLWRTAGKSTETDASAVTIPEPRSAPPSVDDTASATSAAQTPSTGG